MFTSRKVASKWRAWLLEHLPYDQLSSYLLFKRQKHAPNACYRPGQRIYWQNWWTGGIDQRTRNSVESSNGGWMRVTLFSGQLNLSFPQFQFQLERRKMLEQDNTCLFASLTRTVFGSWFGINTAIIRKNLIDIARLVMGFIEYTSRE